MAVILFLILPVLGLDQLLLLEVVGVALQNLLITVPVQMVVLVVVVHFMVATETVGLQHKGILVVVRVMGMVVVRDIPLDQVIKVVVLVVLVL